MYKQFHKKQSYFAFLWHFIFLFCGILFSFFAVFYFPFLWHFVFLFCGKYLLYHNYLLHWDVVEFGGDVEVKLFAEANTYGEEVAVF